MPTKQSTRSDTLKRLAEAKEHYDADPTKPVAVIAREFGVNRLSLQGRINGADPYTEAHSGQQRLENAKEEEVNTRIVRINNMGYPPKKQFVEELAYRILLAKDRDAAPLSNK